jgi:hypothetical protein
MGSVRLRPPMTRDRDGESVRRRCAERSVERCVER